MAKWEDQLVLDWDLLKELRLVAQLVATWETQLVLDWDLLKEQV